MLHIKKCEMSEAIYDHFNSWRGEKLPTVEEPIVAEKQKENAQGKMLRLLPLASLGLRSSWPGGITCRRWLTCPLVSLA